ncbi:MAG: phosphoribosylanthranilate isomerase [Campylobacterales bacterium]
MRVKICGITTLEDAIVCEKNGADAIGFILYKPSSRYIKPEAIREITKNLPPFISKVGVFVEEDSAFVDEVVEFCKLDVAQIYGKTTKLGELKSNYIEVVQAKSKDDIQEHREFKLIDAHVKEYGGEGKRIPLEWFKNRDNSKTILAGGINETNIDEVRPYGFYGVDVSSGVESTKGVKSKEMIERFLKKVRGF